MDERYNKKTTKKQVSVREEYPKPIGIWRIVALFFKILAFLTIASQSDGLPLLACVTIIRYFNED